MHFEPIGFVRSPFREKGEAPRQGVAGGAEATIELVPTTGFRDALSDLAGFERIWVLFHFHLAEGWRPKVQPPRSAVKRGVFATRSPHRPNPIGMTAARLVSVRELTLTVAEVDLVDGTPVLDLKPYVPYADAFPRARAGWVDEARPPDASAEDARAPDPIAAWTVAWSAEAREQAAWLAARGVDLAERLERALALGPAPHAYRRIKKDGEHLRIAVKDWRARFRADPTARTIEILALYTGYRAAELSSDRPELEVPRAFCARFPPR